MAILNYAKNIGRSTAYALPQIIKNRIPSVHALVDQFIDKGQRETNAASLIEIRSIIKEDVFGLMKKGLDNAKGELQSGKLYRTAEEQDAVLGEAFGIDESLLNNDFLNDADLGDGSATATASIAASAAASGAAQGVMAAASRLGDSPAQRAAAEAGIATARFSRASLGAQVAVGNAIRGAVLANAQILGEIHRFQTSVQQSFYHKQLEHNQAMATMTSELLSKLSELKEVSTVAAAATDQVMAAFSGSESDFQKVFGSGRFEAGGYLNVMATRFKRAVGDGSMFKAMGSSIAAAPLAEGFKMALEGLIPKNFGKQLEQFNEFVGGLGTLLNERARAFSKRRSGSLASKFIDFFTMAPEAMAKGPNLSNMVRGKAVAFDGYAHRSLVEVIPSHLADIHSELVAMRRGRGLADPGDRKLYDFKTGRFTSEKLLRASVEKDIEMQSMSKFSGVRRTMGDGGDKQTAKDIHAALRVLGKEQFSINKGNTEAFSAQIDDEADRLDRIGRKDDAARLRAGKKHLVDARKKYGSRFAANLQRSISDYNTVHSKAYQAFATEEGGRRMMFSGEMEGGLSIGAPAPGAKGGKKSKGAAPMHSAADDVLTMGEGEGYQSGKKGSIFRDDSGRVTVSSILRAPMNAVSKAMNAFETKVSDIFFGDGSEKDGLFSRISKSLFGTSTTDKDGKTVREGGLFGGVINSFTSKIFNPLKTAIIGDPSDPSSKAKSIVGTMKRWFGEAVEGGKRFLFGNAKIDENGETSRQGGLFGGVVNWFSGKSKQLKEMLLGKGGDGKQPGLLVGLREKFDRMVDRVQKSLFGTVGEDGKRSGGAFGDQIQKGKDFLKGLWDKFQETAVKPLGTALFGTVVDGKRSGGAFGNAIQKGKDFMSKLWSDTSKFVVQPMKDALFGKDKSFVDDFGNVVSKREGGIFPMLSKTFKESVIEPLAEGLLGKKGADGTRQGGALKVMWASMKDAFAPLKETFVGKDGIWTNMKKGLSDTFRDLKRSLFGAKEGEEDKPFMERIGEKLSASIKRVGDWLTEKMKPVTDAIQKAGDWLKTKVFEPFNKWLNDPQTGFMTRMRNGVATFFYGEKGDDGMRKGGLFGSVKDTMNRFFYGDPEKGTKGFVERVVEPAKKFVLEEIWEPLKKNVGEMWDNTKTFFKEEIFKPLSGVLQPFVTEAKEQWRLMKEWVKGPLFDSIKGIGAQLNDSMKGVFGKSFTDMMRENVLDPIKNALSGVRKFLGDTLKAVFKFPVNILKGASDELAMSQIKRGVYKGSAEERERLMAKMNAKEGDVPAGQGSSLNAKAPEVKPGGGVNEKTTAEKEQKSFWQRAKEAFSGKKGAAADAFVAGAVGGTSPVNSSAPGAKPGGSSSAAATAAAQQRGPNGEKPMTRAEQEAAGAASNGSSVKNGSSKYDPIRAANATADNTHNMYQFMTKHLWGVGKNVEKIVKHMGVKDGALGGNTDEKRPSGFLGKLRKLITNPISFIKDTIAGAFDFVKNIGKRLFEAAKNVVMVPVKLLGKTLSTATKIITSTVKAIAPLAGVLKDALVGTLVSAVKVTSTVLKEGAKAVGTVVSTIAKAIPDVASALASATVGILKAGAQLALGAAKVAGALATTIVKIGAEMLRTAASVAKDIVTGLARITFDAIGSAFNMITGRGKGGKTGKLTPVYVVGGYLAGTEGGAKSMAEAQAIAGGGRFLRSAAGAAIGALSGGGALGALLGAGLGFFSPEMAERIAEGKTSLRMGLKRNKDRMKAQFQSMTDSLKAGKDRIKAGVRNALTGMHTGIADGKESLAGGWQAVKDRTAKAGAAVKEIKWKESLLSASEKTKEHLGGIRSGFSKFGSWMMTLFPMLVSGIGSLVAFFTKGKFVSMLGSLLKGGAGLIGKGAGLVAQGAKGLASKMGGVKGVGLAAAAGVGGALIKGWADDNMEDGAGKTAVKTGGTMLEYGAMGATIGSIIPGVGTAVGAGVGAAAGAVVENWDAIKGGLEKAGKWLSSLPDKLAGLFSDAGKFVSDGIKSFGAGLKDFFLSGGLIGKMLGWTPEKTAQLADDASSAFMGLVNSIKELPGKLLDAAKEFITGIGDKAKSAVKGAWNWLTGGDKVENRAFGGPLGKNGTLVGELGPELLDANGNVIPMNGMRNPALGGAAQQRGDSIAGILEQMQKNSYYTTSLLSSINSAVGGQAVTPLRGANDPVFDPAKNSQGGNSKPTGLFGAMATAFGLSTDTSGAVSEIASTVGSAASEIGEHASSAVKGAASSLWSGIKGAGSALMSGDLRGAASSITKGVSGATDSLKAGAVGISGTVSSAASGVGSIIRGDAGKNIEMLKGFMQQNGMTDPKEQAMFLAQLDHESGGFKVLSENLRYSPDNLLRVFPRYFKDIDEARKAAAGGPEAIANRVYGGRMGNKGDGDGFKYRGRGFIQLTGRDNYVRAGKDLGLDLENNPDLAAVPENAAKIALWYWKQRGLSGPAKSGDIMAVTKGINGGTNGLEDRKSKFAKYLNVVGSGTQLAAGGAPADGVKTAMLGGFLSNMPTLVGERQPEILGPNGQVHRSVDSYLNSPNADVAGLAQSTAIKEAMRRASKGDDGGRANEALGKIASAAGALGGNSEELLKQMLTALNQIVGNTAPISQLAQAAGSGNSPVNADVSQRSATNVFTLGQKPERDPGGMHPSMRRLVAGG